MITYSSVVDKIVFKGLNPMTGVETQVIFNDQNQQNKKLLMWNKLLESWMLSCNAGLTWEKLGRMDVLYPVLFNQIVSTSDLVLRWRTEK